MRQREASRYAGAGWRTLVLAALLLVGIGTARAEDDTTVATINKETITEIEFFVRLQRVRGQDFLLQTTPPSIRTESCGYIVLNSLINERLILQLAAKEKRLPTDAEVNAELENIKKQPNAVEALKNQTVTEDQLKYDIRVQKSHLNLAINGATVTPDEVKQFYEKNIKNYTNPERWSLSAIRTSKLEDIPKIQTALQSGKSFAETARQYSEDDRSNKTGGAIGIFYADDTHLPEEIRTAVKKLNVGDVTPPIPIDFDPGEGKDKIHVYWLIKLMVRDVQSVRPFETVKTQAERLALLEKGGGIKAADEKITAFRDASDLKINLPGYDGLLKKSK